MKSSPKPDETPPSAGSKTPASGRKLVQARLPFKTLSGSEPPFIASNDTTDAAETPNTNGVATINENRKRKQTATLTQEDGVRAPKINRLNKDDDNDDVILLSSEPMDTSNKANDKSSDDQFNQSSESKENVCLKNTDGNETISFDSADGTDDDENETVKTTKAKQSLSFAAPKSEMRKSKRISDANSIRIKLPLTKKEKETAKKTKKEKKSETNGEESESIPVDKRETNGPSTSDAGQSALNESALEIERDDVESNEAVDLNESLLNGSIISNISIDEPSTPSNKLTPKQLQRKAESEKKALEKQHAKLERERKLQMEKEQKRKEREEKEEQKRKEREDREEQKRKEKEERDRKLQDEKEQKQREKEERERKIQEEKEQKQREKEERERKIQEEKEKKKKEREDKERKLQEEKEEKLRKREEAIVAEQSKIRKTSEAFVKFFVPKKGDGKATEDVTEEKSRSEQTQQHFMSFQVKEGMKMAPIMRRILNVEERTSLEEIITDKPAATELYLSQLKNNKFIPRKFGRTLPDDEDEKCSNDEDLFVIDEAGEGVQVIEEKPKKFYRAKFLKFDENRRPPYYGTWRKSSKVLGPRKPFVQDSTFFNYELDSDDEWEEEEPGESLHGSEDEKDHESEDDYDIDNEFFVPHGHLSDEEWQNEDEFDYENAEDHKIKMQLIQKQFDKEMKKKTQKLKPRVIGLIWQNADGSQPENCSSGVWNLLNNNSVYFVGECVKIEPRTNANEPLSDDETANTKSVRRLKIGEKEIPDLIRLINGNTYNIDFLSEEFRAFVAKSNPGQREFTTSSIKNKIRELAMYQRCPENGPMYNKKCWYVPIDVRKRYNVDDLTFPNTWTYTIPPRRPIQSSDLESEKQPKTEQKKSNAPPVEIVDINEDSNNSCGLSETLTPDSVKQAAMKPNTFNIAKFIRVLSEEEKKKQFGPIRIKGSAMDSIDEQQSVAQTAKEKGSTKKRKSAANAPTGAPVPKKRVNLLASVALGEDFSPKTKNTLVTQFLSSKPKKRQSTDDDSSISTRTAGTRDGSKKKKTDVDQTIIVIDD